jgi:hypothetical protein
MLMKKMMMLEIWLASVLIWLCSHKGLLKHVPIERSNLIGKHYAVDSTVSFCWDDILLKLYKILSSMPNHPACWLQLQPIILVKFVQVLSPVLTECEMLRTIYVSHSGFKHNTVWTLIWFRMFLMPCYLFHWLDLQVCPTDTNESALKESRMHSPNTAIFPDLKVPIYLSISSVSCQWSVIFGWLEINL